MAKKISVILAIIMLFTCVFAACGNTADSKTAIVGSWEGVEEGIDVVYTFNADGTGTGEGSGMVMDLTYTIDGNEITITLDTTGAVEDMLGMSIQELLDAGLVTQADVDNLITTDTCTFSIKGDTLIMGGNTYTRKTA